MENNRELICQACGICGERYSCKGICVQANNMLVNLRKDRNEDNKHKRTNSNVTAI